MFSLETKGNVSVVSLPPVLDMSVAEDLLDILQKAFRNSSTIHVEGHNVERVSTPCLQILVSAGRQAEAHDGQFKIISISKGMTRGFEDLGLSDFIGKWSEN